MAVTIVFADQSTLTIDATIQQTHPRSVEVTRHPVEEGADITDHLRFEPRRLTLQCVISQTAYEAGTIGTNPLTGQPELLSPEPAKNRHKAAFDRIEAAMRARELVTVQTGLAVYRNMAIKSFAPVREARTGFDLVFPLELEEVLFAKTQTATVQRSSLGTAKPGASRSEAKAQVAKTQDQASPTGNKGQRATTPASPQQQAATQSWLRRLVS